MMHGLDCEALHGWLRMLKARQAAGLPLDPRSPTANLPLGGGGPPKAVEGG
jgi:hypothetical protein